MKRTAADWALAPLGLIVAGLTYLVAFPLYLARVALFRLLLPWVPTRGHLWEWLGGVAARAPGGVGSLMRRDYHRRQLASQGKGVLYLPNVRISGAQHVSIGDNVAINHNTLIVGFAPIRIGDDALIGPNVVIHSGNHRFDDPHRPVREQGHAAASISIGENAWIGANAVILPGVTIGPRAVIAAGAVVTHDVAPRTIVAGVPARPLQRKEPRTKGRTP